MITLKKSELETVLLSISGFNEKGQMISGLLTESISLGLKRKLQKIHTEAVNNFKELQKDLKDVTDKYKDSEDKVGLEAELKILFDETVNFTADKVSLQMLEDIKTSQNYLFEVLEKISE